MMKEIPWTQGQPTEACRFFVFRFRTKPPHWAAKDGWLAGVAGPYWENEEPDLVPAGVFSRFEAFDSCSPDEHLNKTVELVMKARR